MESIWQETKLPAFPRLRGDVHTDVLIIGGGSRTGRKNGNWAELRAFARAHYPRAREVGFWAAQDCMSLDQMPYIGQYSA